MYKIFLEDGRLVWFNERIIRVIYQNEDGTFTLEHFNDSKIIIKGFHKL
jgi:hypothetical protein